MPTPYLLLFFKKVEPFMRCEGVYVQETVDVVCWLDYVAFPGVWSPQLCWLQWLVVVRVVAYLVLQMFSGSVEIMLREDGGLCENTLR